jgi:hypothetical protein
MRVALFLILILAALLVHDRAQAQAALRASEEQVVNYAFATQLGSGIYNISGRTLQIYRLPFGYTFTQPEGKRPGVRLTLPVTIGFVNFLPRDVLDTGLPENLDTLSFEPGVELDYALTREWHLVPFAQAGRCWDRTGDGDATVYSFGAHLTGLVGWRTLDLRFDVGALYAAVDSRAAGVASDDLVVIELGLEARRGLGLTLAGHPLDWGAYFLNQTFINRADEPVDRAPGQASQYQFETGVTIGPQSRMTVWKIPVPRLGLGYRFGDNLGVWRFVIGVPF